MKITPCRKFSAVCLIVYALIVCMTSIEAQRETVVKSSKRNYKAQSLRKKAKTKRKPQIISTGIVNGKAMNLVKPEFPATARAVGIYGMVSVAVLIDENGDVLEASASNGHPFLQPVSIKAALESKFEPITLGGVPVRVRGIIVYNFIPQNWNWLEIGYTLGYNSNYYSIKTLVETLPFGYEEERQPLNLWFEANESQERIIETIIASIRSKINNDPKTFWLFDVGLALAKSKQKWNVGGHTLNKNSQSFQNLKQLVQNPPSDAEKTLLERIKKFIVFVEELKTTQAFLALRELEESFPYAGR